MRVDVAMAVVDTNEEVLIKCAIPASGLLAEVSDELKLWVAYRLPAQPELAAHLGIVPVKILISLNGYDNLVLAFGNEQIFIVCREEHVRFVIPKVWEILGYDPASRNVLFTSQDLKPWSGKRRNEYYLA